jgi:hypothetical protein
MTMKLPGWITPLALAAAVLGAPRVARAEGALAADVDLAVPVIQAPQHFLSTGAGFDLRGGYRFRVPYQSISIVPELALGYTFLGAHLVRLRPGLRLGIGRVLVPYVYGHVGYAWTSFDPLGAADVNEKQAFVSTSALSFDFGGGLDVAILRRLMVGAHVGYNVVNVGTTDRTTLEWRAKWINLGVTATLHL